MALRSNQPDHPLLAKVEQALSTVIDPEIKKPVTELGMVDRVSITDGRVEVTILLTVSGCPMKDTLTSDTQAALNAIPEVTEAQVNLGVMNDQQRAELRQQLRGGVAEKEIPFAKPDSLTRVIAIASGKGGVGKSSLTTNLALALAEQGAKVGILDADIYGHSIPTLVGSADARPTSLDDMILPVPALGLKVISIGMLKAAKSDVVAWRGPILDRALHQLMADVYWGDLDYLIVDLPPGTGDVQISLGQKLPNAEVVVVTTPQLAASEVAERAGSMAAMMNQKVIGVVENMAYYEARAPQSGEVHTEYIFGQGGGQRVADELTTRLGYKVPLLGEIALDPRLREGGDNGDPIVLSEPDSAASVAISDIARDISQHGRKLAGRQLGLTPAGR